MRVAVLHDYLNQFGGAERVLKEILEIFPEADLYTLLYDKDKTFGWFEKNFKKSSFLDRAFVRKRHRLFIPLMPLAAGALRGNQEYDLVFSSTAGYAKGFGVKGKIHICYCHSPLRYAWEFDYLRYMPLAPQLLKETIGWPIVKRLRQWDKRAAGKVNFFIANSKYIAKQIASYYGQNSQVINPPVADIFFEKPKKEQSKEDSDASAGAGYFLMFGRLLYYKGFDLGVKAFNQLQLPLKIVGRGPEEKKIKNLNTSSRTEFKNYVSDRELRDLYRGARALIFPQIEDFGLVAAEAQACGLPVIAFDRGGSRDIVIDGKTGLFFKEQKPEAIVKAVKDFQKMSFDRDFIAHQAERFSRKNFHQQIREVVAQHSL